jgi:hypothetical protein
MRVIKKLVTGKGVSYRNKPRETFLLGYKLTPGDDLENIRHEAIQWLPHVKGPNCLDKGHGWALHHPLQKLKAYKQWRTRNASSVSVTRSTK